MFDLNGRTALVTGSSRGIGRGIALSLASAGADIVVNYKESLKEANEVVDSIVKTGRSAVAVKADVTKEEEVKTMMDACINTFGRLDILVNNTGTTRNENIFDTTLENWQKIVDTNLTSCFLCSKYALEIMKKRGFGRIIQVSSIVGHRGALYGHVHYGATKSGQLGFTKTLAYTAAPYGITVNSIAPGLIATELLYKTHGEHEIEVLSKSIPLGLGKVEDVGAAAVYLSSDEAGFITGATIDINGGMYLR
jgi:3-oxoacyl-[acyl-carrier protein] reductase